MGHRVMLNRLKGMVERAPMAMLAYDGQDLIVECNQAAAQLLGICGRELLGHSVCEFFPEKNETGPRRWRSMAWAAGVVDLLATARTIEGETVDCRLLAMALKDEANPELQETVLYIRRDGCAEMLDAETMRKIDEAQQRADLLNAIIDGEIADKEIAVQRGKSLGLDLTARYALFAVNIDDYAGKSYEQLQKDQRGMKEILRQVTHVCSAEQDKIVWTRYDGFAVLCPLPENCIDAKNHALTRARSGKDRVMGQMPGVTVTVGVSSSYRDILDLRRCYREAREAADVGRRVWGGNEVYHYSDLGICQLLTQFQDAEPLQGFVEQSIGKLIQYDKRRKSELVKTLEHLLLTSTIKEAAERSFVHPKTILLRKSRIEEILGLSLDDVETRLTLCTALRIMRLMKK